MASVEGIKDDKGKVRGYRARWRDPEGKSRRKVFPMRKDAEAFLHKIETDKNAGEYLNPRAGRKRLRDVAEDWQATLTAHTNKPKTIAGYDSLLRNHVLERLGERQVRSITTTDVRKWLADLSRAGVGAGTQRNAYRVLKMVLQSAVESQLIRTNPCAGLNPRKDLPKSRNEGKVRGLTLIQVRDLADAIAPPYAALVHFAARTGLRAGELGGLRMENFDPLSGTVHVVESLSEVGGRLHFVTPKSGKDRTLTIPRYLREMMRDYLAGQPPKGPRDLVFTATRGGPLVHHHFYALRFRPAVRAAGLPASTRFHDLRHTAASWMIAKGAHVKLVADRLGHSTITVTMDRYGHLLPGLEDKVNDAADAAYTSLTPTPSNVRGLRG